MKSLICLLASAAAVLAADPFAENIRTTDPLTPAEEAQTFKLPPGFKIDLVAAEPDIYKPMNLAFDSQGRLWVSCSKEYPFPVPLDKPAHDVIKILEDFDENGRARKITTFAEGLNIPIGLYPYKNGVIAWSIPNIWYFEDTDGDGKADQRHPLIGPFGWERDTHGNQASFTRGFDGWLYATHGYNNISKVHGRDGHEVSMQSGNTYRFRLDGSRIEQHTHGQVNPFGLCFDPSGDIYSADCHSAPIYELLHGAYYPSFGKPHDGLGFGPVLMEHSHGSTAICGIIFYADDLWPEEFQNNILIGNVMTSRLNRDHLVEHGSSKRAIEQPDFMSTTDPWFRPVTQQLGPDGALYVADFYNRIIGHYEVPLNHPGRDRYRARIWRISYTGKPLRDIPNFSATDALHLIREFRSPNLPRRMLAMNELVDRVGASSVNLLRDNLQREDLTAPEIVHTLWALQRLGSLESATLRKMLQRPERDVRVHVMRILAEDANFGALRQTAGIQALRDSDALVQREAAEALARNPEQEIYVRPLLTLIHQVPENDPQLLHMARMALRNQLAEGGPALSYRRYKAEDAAVIADICLAIPEEDAATFLLEHIQAHPDAPRTADYVRHAARYITGEGADKLAQFIRANFQDNLDQQLAFFRAVQEGSAQRGAPLGDTARAWGTSLAAGLLNSAGAEEQPWWNQPLPKPTANPWFLQERASRDGDKKSLFFCSLMPGGEALTGRLRSRPFKIPARLSFYIAGHDGFPAEARHDHNLVRLVAADSGKVIAQAPAPRNDLAQPVEWDLSSSAGTEGYLEIVDDDTGSAYAWIAAGRFEPPVVPLPKLSPNQVSARVRAAAEIAQTFRLASLAPEINRLIASNRVDDDAQAALAGALAAIDPNPERTMLAPLLDDDTIPAELRREIGRALASGHQGQGLEAVASAMRSTPSRVQLRLAQNLAASGGGMEALLQLAEKGAMSPRVLLDKGIETKLKAGAPAALQERIARLTANLEPASELTQKQIEKVRASYNAEHGSAEHGAIVFAQTCALCHQIGGVGAVIGPQLDGIGSRGLERILEDVLDPSRNVDINFRTHALILKDGDVITGILRREEGETIVLADSTGKEIAIPKSNIETRRESETSIMPSNFGDAIPEPDLRDLLAFLLSKNAAQAK